MPETTSELGAGVSTIRLAATLKSGPLTVSAQEFTNHGDRTVIAHARSGEIDVYRAFFSHDDDATVFAVISDDGVTTRVSLQDDSSHEGVGRVNIWNDGQMEQSFSIDIKKFVKTRDPQTSIMASRGAPLDQVGRRKPPEITPEEIVDAFADTDAFKGFMRGAEHHEKAIKKSSGRGVNWKCAWICTIPACGLACLFWKINKPDPKPKPT
jgi:hypothetical protein